MYFTVSSDPATAAAVGGSLEGAGATAAQSGGGTSSSGGSGLKGNGQHGHNSDGTDGAGDKGDPVGLRPLAGGVTVGAGDVDGGGRGDPSLVGGGGVRGSSGGEGGHGDRTIETGCGHSVGDGGGPARLTVVSNDEMRNHRMALLEPVPFKR